MGVVEYQHVHYRQFHDGVTSDVVNNDSDNERCGFLLYISYFL